MTRIHLKLSCPWLAWALVVACASAPGCSDPSQSSEASGAEASGGKGTAGAPAQAGAGGAGKADPEPEPPPVLASCQELLDYYQDEGEAPPSGIFTISPGAESLPV